MGGGLSGFRGDQSRGHESYPDQEQIIFWDLGI